MDGSSIFNNTMLVNGLIQSNGYPIFSYVYSAGNNLPAFIFDKPSQYFTGIGSHGAADEIFFGAVDTSTYNWVDDYTQKWYFNGQVQAPLGFTTDNTCRLLVMGYNELDIYTNYTGNSDFWINYRTPSGSVKRDTIIIGDGEAGRGWITACAHIVSGNDGTNYMGLSRDGGGVRAAGLWDYLAGCWALVSNGSYTQLQENIYINKELMVGGDGGKGHIRLTNGSKSVLLRFDGENFWILGSDYATFGDNWKEYDIGHPLYLSLSDGSLHASKLYGAVWNDYAEYRKAESIEPGRCVIEQASKEMKLSTERLQPGAEIISDTFGFAIGETNECKTPIAATGRVLAYPYEDRDSYPLGAAVCSGPNGTVSLMTREEIKEYPERIIGTVSEIPDYEEWGTGKVKVDGRIWIRIR